MFNIRVQVVAQSLNKYSGVKELTRNPNWYFIKVFGRHLRHAFTGYNYGHVRPFERMNCYANTRGFLSSCHSRRPHNKAFLEERSLMGVHRAGFNLSCIGNERRDVATCMGDDQEIVGKGDFFFDLN